MIRLGLESISLLCDKLNNPQNNLQYIHVAGTNGKGSTSAFIASILQDAKLKVGMYSSPAVMNDEEIIKINGRAISKANYKKNLEIVNEAGEKLVAEGKSMPTEFEIITALAFKYFSDNECDVVVLECGMGGRLDATNIVNNTLACVFTSISMDHIDYLGTSLHKIAQNKAGIIKPNAKIYTTNTNNDVISALNEEADKYNTEVNIIESDSAILKHLTMKASYQIENASLASAVAKGISRIKNKNGDYVEINDKNIENGLHKAVLSGRFEKVSINPTIIIDGAHNEGAAIALVRALKNKYKNKEFIFVIGMLVNKDHDKVLEIMLPLAKQVLTVSTHGERGFSSDDLAKVAVKYHNSVSSIGGLHEALDIASLMADKKDIIVVFGSLSFLKDVKKWIKEKQK